MSTRNRVEFFGDSILKGIVLDAEQKYRVSPVLDVQSLGSELGLQIENRSRMGCTSEKGMAMLERCLSRGEQYDAVLLGYGGNDADFRWDEIAAAPEAEHRPNTTLDRFTELYRSAIARLQRLGIRPVLITLPPVCAERYFHWITRNGLDADRILSWLGDVEAIYRYQERYSRTLEKLAKESGCDCIDLRGALLQERRLEPLYCTDGIHPNELGQQIIRDALAGFFRSDALMSA